MVTQTLQKHTSTVDATAPVFNVQLQKWLAAEKSGDAAKVVVVQDDGNIIDAEVVEPETRRMSMAEILKRSEELKKSKTQTPLEYAARKGSIELVQMLLENGADINARDTNGRAALDVVPRKLKATTKIPSPEEVFATQVDNGMGKEVFAAIANGVKPTPEQIDEAVRKALDLKPLDGTKINVDRVIERFCTVEALLGAGVAPLRATITYAEEMKNPQLAQKLTVARRQYHPAF